ncbi:hypothetical protein NLN92_23530 [Citrobacter portucalensis]|uniref:F4 family fimbrial subunit n=1 Tax=Citrobacter portucalensis TaxID=1639133 RepID=UPI00226B6B1F|nr:hypothetical protein [Citrobacter portucalensis]MCX8980966.1 hypothetical protein [Citrobacter portucalensis]
MNKNLLALVVASLIGVATPVMAATFSSTSTGGTVDINGEIVVPPAQGVWAWDTPIDQVMDSTIAALSNGGKTLTMPAANNIMVIAGNMTDVVAGGVAGLSNNKVSIVLTDKNGKTVPITLDTVANSGKAKLTLPVTDDAGTNQIGTMKLPVKIAQGITMAAQADSFPTFLSAVSTNSPAGLFVNNGPYFNSATNALLPGLANQWLSDMGIDISKITPKYNAKLSKTFPGSFNFGQGVSSDSTSSPSYYYAGMYAMGVPKNDSVVIDFNNAITTNTKWKTSLTVNITYL